MAWNIIMQKRIGTEGEVWISPSGSRFIWRTARGGWCLMPTLTVGARYRLAHDIERYPNFIAKTGLTGTLILTGAEVLLQMDEPLDGAEDWDNCIQWIPADGDDAAADLEVIK
jgi:hypothetical protein